MDSRPLVIVLLGVFVLLAGGVRRSFINLKRAVEATTLPFIRDSTWRGTSRNDKAYTTRVYNRYASVLYRREVQGRAIFETITMHLSGSREELKIAFEEGKPVPWVNVGNPFTLLLVLPGSTEKAHTILLSVRRAAMASLL